MQITLENHFGIFHQESLNDIRKVNFFYGKNGTGKSTIASSIKEEYSEEYKVQIFDGYEKIFGVNQSLKAIALGVHNKEIQEEIEVVDDEITHLNNKLINQDPLELGLNIQIQNINKNISELSSNSDRIGTNIASDIHTHEPSITRGIRIYNRSNVKRELTKAKLITKEEYEKNIKILSLNEKNEPPMLTFPEYNIVELEDSINKILTSKIRPSILIKELEENQRKYSFAKEGYSIHRHRNEKGDSIRDFNCAFCDNEISTERWDELDSYFSNTFDEFESRIESKINEISDIKKKLREFKINRSNYYPQFEAVINDLNLKIYERITNDSNTFEMIINLLQEKKLTMSKTMDEISLDDCLNFTQENDAYKHIYADNTHFHNNIERNKDAASEKIRLHHLKELLEENNYHRMQFEIEKEKEEKNKLEKNKNEIMNQIEILEKEKSELASQTVSEETMATKINEYLKALGNNTFQLELVNGESQEGLYLIRGINEDGSLLELRNIYEISEGEKNLIAFLYFIIHTDEIMNSSDDKFLIIFDDPMTSNDDVSQYLMISLIQQLYNNIKDDDNSDNKFFLLTHNTFFYLNVRQFRPSYGTSGSNGKYAYFLLEKSLGKTSVNRIYNENKNNDIMSDYDSLWNHLYKSYENDETIIMWNLIRRIIETLATFNKMDYGELLTNFEDSTSNILGNMLKKSLDVNSHGLQVSDHNVSTFNKNQLKAFLKKVLVKISLENHFESYWKD